MGDFLGELLTPGMSVDWKELLEETTGSALTAEPMLRYYAPLLEWLRKENKGRKATLAEI